LAIDILAAMDSLLQMATPMPMAEAIRSLSISCCQNFSYEICLDMNLMPLENEFPFNNYTFVIHPKIFSTWHLFEKAFRAGFACDPLVSLLWGKIEVCPPGA
jgi:hypothetical protein